MKRIQDSVHGCINVDKLFFEHIIDTPNYQRLRHIEQTSIRSIFPSARHDRFIHSLGVFHIGKMIVAQLDKEWGAWGIAKSRKEQIVQSYLMACLLHDVGHAPFSHTFEEYYGPQADLAEQLCALLHEEFKADLDDVRSPAHHEYASAIITHKVYRNAVDILGGNIELIIRMIIGCHYKDPAKQIENCFISLLHGDVIDADRLDYACRDVWASGYCTSTIDLNRLISAIHIKKNNSNQFVVCFNSNAINEIESVINVKDFQVKYVLNHHTVKYDQWLLVKAVETVALELFLDKIDAGNNKDDTTATAMRKLCNIKYLETDSNEDIQYNIKYLTDADFMFLMKQNADNPYCNEWFSRQYTMFPLWKSREEFYFHFSDINVSKDLSNVRFEDVIKKTVASIQGYNDSDVLILKAKYKARVKMDSIYIDIHGNVTKYTDLQSQIPKEVERVDNTFYYVYIDKKGLTKHEIENRRLEILSALRRPLTNIYIKG